MSAEQYPPPYPGFAPHIAPGAGPYPGGGDYPPQQYPGGGAYPQQQYPGGGAYPQQQYPGGAYPQQNYPNAGPYPPQGYPSGGPQPQYPTSPQFPSQQYPKPPGQGNLGPFIPPPTAIPMHFPGAQDYPKDETTEVTAGWSGFSDKAIRAVFVRKVYLILMVQLLFSLGVIALFVFHPKVKLFVRRHSYLYYVSYAIFLGVYIALACCGNLRRKYPTNMILLSIFTMAMSYMLGTMSSFYDTEVVLMAVGICAGVCLAVSLFSFHTKFDFTSCGGILFIVAIVFFLFGIITIFTYNRIMLTIYAAGGALLFTLFLAYDTQMLMGGKKHELSPEEHIFAAMQLYLDIVNIFMYLLMLLNLGRGD